MSKSSTVEQLRQSYLDEFMARKKRGLVHVLHRSKSKAVDLVFRITSYKAFLEMCKKEDLE